MPLSEPDELIWKEPPPDSRGPRAGTSARILAQLKAHPGEWALVATGASINALGGFRPQFKHAGCEVMGRTAPDGTGQLFARFPAK